VTAARCADALDRADVARFAAIVSSVTGLTGPNAEAGALRLGRRLCALFRTRSRPST
jgi:hypothetical protein